MIQNTLKKVMIQTEKLGKDNVSGSIHHIVSL